MSKILLAILAFLLIANSAIAETSLKTLITSDCDKALVEFQKLPEIELPELIEFLDRVLELESSTIAAENPLKLPMAFTPNPAGLGGNDFLRSWKPTRGIDSKVCAMKISRLVPSHSGVLLPGLIRLESDLLLSREARLQTREAIREVAVATRRQLNGDGLTVILLQLPPLLNERTYWSIESLLVEFAPESRRILSSLKENPVPLSGPLTLEVDHRLQQLNVPQETDVAVKICHAGACDKAFLEQIARTADDRTSQVLLLRDISRAEVLDGEAWQFVMSIWKGGDPALTYLALEALGAFPARRTEALVEARALIKSLNAPPLKVHSEKRSSALRSLCRLLIQLEPVPADLISNKLGEEILNLGVNSEEPLLSAKALLSVNPLPIALLNSALRSSSEAARNQALHVVFVARPNDERIISALLELAVGQEDLEEDQKRIFPTAKQALKELADQAVPALEKAMRKKSGATSVLAASQLLAVRPSNKLAGDLMLSILEKSNCRKRLEYFQLVHQFHPNRKILIECKKELLQDADLRTKLVKVLQPIDSEEWKLLLDGEDAITGLNLCNELPISGERSAAQILKEVLSESKGEHELRLAATCAIKISLQLPQEGARSLGEVFKELLKTEKQPVALNKYLLTAAINLSGPSAELVESLSFTAVTREASTFYAENLSAEAFSAVVRKLINKPLNTTPLRQLLCARNEASPETVKVLLESARNAEDDELPDVILALSCVGGSSEELQNLLLIATRSRSWKALEVEPRNKTLSEEFFALRAATKSNFERALFSKR